MAAVAILVCDFSYLPFCVTSIGSGVRYLHVKFHQDRIIFGRVIVIWVNSRWRPPLFYFDFILRNLCYFNRVWWYAPVWQNSSRLDDIWLSYSGLREFKMAAAAILVFLFILPLLRHLDRACFTAPACQMSSRTDDIWANYGDLSEFKMAAAAILFFNFIIPVLRYVNRACSCVPACQISSRSDDIWASYGDLSEFKMAATAILHFWFLTSGFLFAQ